MDTIVVPCFFDSQCKLITGAINTVLQLVIELGFFDNVDNDVIFVAFE